MNARAAALQILIKVTEHGAYLSDTLRLHFKELPDRQDRAFVSFLCTGTVKRLIEVDFRINLYAKTKIKKMHPIVRNILRMGAYQLLYMDGVPASAAVNESVKLAKKNGQAKASGMINGILRSMAREDKPWPFTGRKPRTAAECALVFSVPEWIAERFAGRFGLEGAKEILSACLSPAPLTIRVNTSRIAPGELAKRLAGEGVTVKAADAAYVLENVGIVEALASFNEGLFFVQDLSSMEPAAAAGIRPGDTVVDVCAAPGGKAMHAADILMTQASGRDSGDAADRGMAPERSQAAGLVIARDVSEAKVAKIRENIDRAGFTNIRAEVWDARVFDERMAGKADVVIADLPCSGLGVLKRKPEIKFRVTEDDIALLSRLQQEILDTVCEYVTDGGKLVYSTCTLTEEENEGNVRRFLEAHKDFSLISEKTILPDALRDGFFVAVLKRYGKN